MINNNAIAFSKISSPSQQIVFIDSQVENVKLLAAGVLPGIETVILNPHSDGIEQITSVLRQRNNLTAIHIVSHGSPGCLYLGNTQLSLDTLETYQHDLKTWFNIPPLLRGARGDQNTLLRGARGDLLLYGCNVAAGDAGAEFITKLHNITGAKIAASTTPIGNQHKGGNWELDLTSLDKPNLAFTKSLQQSYAGIFMADANIDLDLDDSSTQTGNDYQASFVSGNAVPISGGDVTITTSNTNSNIVSANIKLTNPLDGDAESLSIDDAALPVGITASAYDPATGILTLTGSATATEYQLAISQIEYNNTNLTDPANRHIEVTVNDGDGDSPVATSLICVVPPPVLNNDYQTTFTEGGSPVAIGDVDTDITDLNDTNMQSAIITLTNRPDGDAVESLSVNGTLPAGITASAYDPATGTITLTGDASIEDYETAIAQIEYNNTDLTDLTNREVKVVVDDGIHASNTATTTIEVIPTYSLSGTVYDDTNAPDTDTIETTDTPIENVTVEIYEDDGSGNPQGDVISSTITNATGFYEFTNLPDGNYVVVQTQPIGYTSVTDADGNQQNKILATIAGADVIEQDFLEEIPPALYSLSGTVYDDADNDAVFSGGDTPISGVTVEIFTDDGNGNPLGGAIASETTDATGFYKFTNLPDGSYVVVETQPIGYASVTDADGNQQNKILATIAGADVTEQDFLEEEASFDYGDAPDTAPGSAPAPDDTTDTTPPDYQSTADDGGASHELKEDCPITIGETVDGDDGSQQDPTATADDTADSGDDEDGVTVSGTGKSLDNADIFGVVGTNFSVDVTVNQAPQAPTGQASTVTGTIFNDYDSDGNADGTQTIDLDNGSTTTSTEGGIAGVTVTAYDNAGNEVDSTTTDANGSYTLNNPNGEPLRIEIDTPDGYNHTSSSDIFLDGSGDPTVDIGLLKDNHYVDSSSAPRLLTTCFVIGGYDQGDAALVSVLHTDSGQDPTSKDEIVTYNQVGTTYGIAYNSATEDIFLGAFQRRHSDIGPDGNDAIYRVDKDGNLNTLVELDTYFGTTDIAGAYAHGDGDTEADRTGIDWQTDKDAFAAVTKAGFGDVEISGDGKYLYTINLHDRKLYKIEVGDGSTFEPLADGESRIIQSYDILGDDNASPTNGGIPLNVLGLNPTQNIRPFAIAEQDGKIYVGMINSAQYADGVDPDNGGVEGSTSSDDLHAYVYSFNPENPGFTEELNFPLNYARESKDSSLYSSSEWNPWVDDFSNLDTQRITSRFTDVVTTQPILSDIEFDNNGDIIIGFRDRTADQFGTGQSPDGSAIDYSVSSGGDILRGAWDGSNWTIEPSVTDTDNDTNTNSEFYGGEEFGDEFGAHHETSQGGLTQIPGYNSVETTALDPLEFLTGGIIGLDNTSGDQTRPIELFEGGFEKANGLGDLEHIAPPAPIVIGNRLWIDVNKDGIQDAGEVGISGATVSLYDENDVLVGTTTTDESGEYYFNNKNVVNADGTEGLKPKTAYSIRLDNDADFAAGGVLENLSITAENANGNSNDTLDSDAILDSSGTHIIDITTESYGENNFSYDFGFTKEITLVGWIDFNRDGEFTSDEAVILDTSNELKTDGSANTLQFPIPNEGIKSGPTAARFRVATGLTGENLDGTTPDGAAPDGEVEDYIVNLIEPASLGDKVFLDNDGDGIQDANEPGVSGVDVTLTGGGVDGIINDDPDTPEDESADNTTATTTTDGAGNYEFTELNPGEEYQVSFDETTLPEATEFTSADQGGDETADSDANADGVTPIVTLTPGENNPDIDAGVLPLYKLSGTVYEDTNAPDADGIEDTDTPIESVTVSLFNADASGNPTGAAISSTTTDSSGNYEFTDLANGDYVVVQTQPAGYDSVTDVDGNDDNQITATIADADSVDNDFLEEIARATIAGRVWDDADRNGLEGAFESGVENITVRLTGGGADGLISTPDDNNVETLTTDSSGEYEFTGLTPGIEYQVTFDSTSFPPEYADGLTGKDTGSDDQIDSDADIATGQTPIITLTPGESRTGIDAGLLTPEDNLIEGTPSPDNIVGTSSNETIAGYKGQDTLTGGDGEDRFSYNETSDGVDIITDFTSGEDQVILTKILEDELGYTGSDPIADGHVVLADYGSAGTMVQIDFDGTNGLLPKDVVFLEGVSNLDANSDNDFDPETDLAF